MFHAADPASPSSVPMIEPVRSLHVAHIPPTLMRPFVWEANSCHLDTYLEAMYACALKLPGFLTDRKIGLSPQNIWTLFSVCQDPMERLVYILHARHHTPDSRLLQEVKMEFWRVMAILSENQLRFAETGNPYDWLYHLGGSLIEQKFTVHGMCPLHGKQALRDSKMVTSVTLRTGATLTEGLDLWTGRQRRSEPCLTYKCETKATQWYGDFKTSPIMLIGTNSPFSLDERVWLTSSAYELVAAIRFIPGYSHFVAYVKHGQQWFFYDGMGPRVYPVHASTTHDLSADSSLYFFVKN